MALTTATNTSSSSSSSLLLLLLRPRRRRSDFKKLPTSRARASCFSSSRSAFSLTSIDDRERRKTTTTALRRKRRDVRANVSLFFFSLRDDDVALFSLLAASLVGVLRKGDEKKSSSSSSSSSSAVLFASLVFLPARVARWCCGKQAFQVFAALVLANVFALHRVEPLASSGLLESGLGRALIEYAQLGMFVAFAPQRWMDFLRSDWRAAAAACAFVCAALWKEARIGGGGRFSFDGVVRFVRNVKSGNKNGGGGGGGGVGGAVVHYIRILPLALSATFILARVLAVRGVRLF